MSGCALERPGTPRRARGPARRLAFGVVRVAVLPAVIATAAPIGAAAQVEDGAAVSEDAPFAFLLGRWEGSGELFGRPAVFSMEWRAALEGRFVALSFENAFAAPDGPVTRVLRATAFYAAEPPHAGVWLDTRGEILRLAAEVSDSAVVTRWASDTEEGRTTYRAAGPGRIDVVDEVLAEGGWRVFARAEYEKVTAAGESGAGGDGDEGAEGDREESGEGGDREEGGEGPGSP